MIDVSTMPEHVLQTLAKGTNIGPIEAMTAATADYPSDPKPRELEWCDWALAVLCQRLARISDPTRTDWPILIPVDSVE